VWVDFIHTIQNAITENYMMKPPRKEVSVLLFTIVNILKYNISKLQK
jgi:hypothetical protein